MKAPLLTLSVCLFMSLSSLQAQVNVKLVKDLYRFGSSKPNSLVVAGDKMFFFAFDGTTNALFVTKGDSASTIDLGPTGAVSYTFNFLTAYNGKAYFAVDDNSHGTELWVSDGTVAGTKLFMDIYPGSTASNPLYLTVANNKLFFMADLPSNNRQLFVSDGTVTGTKVIKNDFCDNFNGTTTLVVNGNDVLFKSDNGTGPNVGYGLWASDGTAAGTILLKGDFNPANGAGNSASLNGKVYFGGDDNVNGLELWATDNTPAGTYLVKNISPGDGGGVFANSSPQAFCLYGNNVYFSATDGTHGQELWVTDGTSANTHMVKDVEPGSNGSLPYHSIVYNNKLYFIAWGLQQLWVTDGTDANTKLVAPLSNNSQFAAIWNNLMYFESPDNPVVYQSDGTTAGTVPVKAANTASPIYYSSTDYHYTVFNNELYFSGEVTGITEGYELVKLTTGALPVTLTSFAGQAVKGDDLLTWQTAAESNTAYFEVQQAADGVNFIKAASIAAAGNSNSLKIYNYQQKSTLNPAGFYRLKMVDKNGAFVYSNIIKISRNNIAGLTAFYNSAGRQIIIQNNTNTVCNWQLYTASGALVKKGVSSAGSISVPASGLAGGVYMLACQSASGNNKFTLPVF